MVLSRPLIAFAFLAEKFEETGDLAQGLMPLFAPIISKHEGQEFSAEDFSEDVSNYYGIRVHPWAVQDWLSRLERERYVEKVSLAGGLYSYRYLKSPVDVKTIEETDVTKLLEVFCKHAQKRFEVQGIAISKATLEQGFFDRLVSMDFLSIVLKPEAPKEPPKYTKDTLRLPVSTVQDEDRHRQEQEAQIDYVCADFILTTSVENPGLFEILVQITCGALVAEVILDFQVPAKKVEFKNLTVYLDAPFIMDLLDLSYPENVRYSGELFKQLKDTSARISVFPHSIEEMRGAIKAPLDRFERGELATGPTGSRLRSSTFRAYARSVISSVEADVKDLGISIANTSHLKSPQSRQFFTSLEEEDLSQSIGHYENVTARQRDAGSIGNVIRLRQRADVPMHNISACRAIFLTRNSRLAQKSTDFLIGKGVIGNRSVPPCIHDRYMAGLLWITQGGKGKELSRQRLLANCASAISPRQDVVKRMHSFLSELDERKARHFQALMTNSKAAHYLMNRALGDAGLITRENVAEVYEEVERIAAEKVTVEKNAEIEKLHIDYKEIVRAKDQELSKSKTELDANVAVKRAQEDAYAASEDAFASQLLAKKEKKRADELATTLGEVLAERERTNRLAIEQAVSFARNVQLRAQIHVAIGIGLLSIVLGLAANYAPIIFGQESLGTNLTVLVSIGMTGLLTAVQFWVFPEQLFGQYVTRKRDEALFRKARELNVADLLESYSVEWSKGTVRKKDNS